MHGLARDRENQVDSHMSDAQSLQAIQVGAGLNGPKEDSGDDLLGFSAHLIPAVSVTDAGFGSAVDMTWPPTG